MTGKLEVSNSSLQKVIFCIYNKSHYVHSLCTQTQNWNTPVAFALQIMSLVLHNQSILVQLNNKNIIYTTFIYQIAASYT